MTHVWCRVCSKHAIKDVDEYSDVYQWMCDRCRAAYLREQEEERQEYKHRQRMHEVSMAYLLFQVLGLCKREEPKPRKKIIEVPEDELL